MGKTIYWQSAAVMVAGAEPNRKQIMHNDQLKQARDGLKLMLDTQNNKVPIFDEAAVKYALAALSAAPETAQEQPPSIEAYQQSNAVKQISEFDQAGALIGFAHACAAKVNAAAPVQPASKSNVQKVHIANKEFDTSSPTSTPSTHAADVSINGGNIDISSSKEASEQFDEREERNRLDAEELEALHICLDKAGVPRANRSGLTFSAWGRVVNYAASDAGQEAREAAQEPTRHELQAQGKHPAPCARFCEATAFNVEIRSLKARLDAQPAPARDACAISWDGKNVYGDKASIDAVRIALHDAGTVPALKDRICAMQSQPAGDSR